MPTDALDGIDAVYIINLDRDPKRMAEMADQCVAHGIPFKRVPAIDGRTVSPRVLSQMATPFCQKFCTPSMIGCALSHMRVWKAVLQAGYARVLVLEDDAQLVPDFKERLSQALSDVPSDFDVLVCGCMFLCQKERKYSFMHRLAKPFVNASLRDDSRTWGSVFVPEYFGGTHCYVVSNKGCRSLFKTIPRVSNHIDMTMNHPGLQLYAVSPDLAHQRDMSTSSIASFSFPKTLMPTLETIRDDKRIPLAYYMSVPYMQVGAFKVNVWMLLFFVLGLVGPRAAPYVVGFLLAELIVGGAILPASLVFLLGWGVRWVALRPH